MTRHRLIPALLLALVASASSASTAGAGGGGGVEGPAANPMKGAPASVAASEAQAATAAGQIAAQTPDGTEDDRRRKQLEIYRLSAEIAQLAAEFGQ